MTRTVFALIALLTFLAGCTLGRTQSEIVFVTATPAVTVAGNTVQEPVEQPTAPPRADLSPVPEALAFVPTQNAGHSVSVAQAVAHVVQAGDTLSGIAVSYGTTIDTLMELNELANPDSLFIGQVINLPDLPTEVTPGFKIIADGKVVRSPGSSDFDVMAFVVEQPGYIRTASDRVETRRANGSVDIERLSAAQVVDRVALEFSVDSRLLLALLEFRAGWLSNPSPALDQRQHPLISEQDSGDVDRAGLYKQLAWAANQINAGYYGWKYSDLQVITFGEDSRMLIDAGLNPGTVAIQYFLSLNTSFLRWAHEVTQQGFFTLYWQYFGDPFSDVVDPVVPDTLVQPRLVLPFGEGETWFFTGGWHGGWGNGSAWAAVDFAPPDDPSTTGGVLCYTSDFPVRAVANGVIARSEDGVVVLDLDGDMDEATGWTILYLHLAEFRRIAAGVRVLAGEVVGYASCEGGFSTATHLHIARRYNGEWIPADCQFCPEVYRRPSFQMGEWRVVGLQNQLYQGFIVSVSGERRVADQGRSNPDNQVSR